MKSLKILLIGCCAEDMELLAAELAKGGYKAEITFSTCFDGRAIAATESWDIAFCGLTARNAATILRILKQQNIGLPLIVLADQTTENQALELMKVGACDYILKEDLKRLVSVVERELARVCSAKKQKETLSIVENQKKMLGFLDFLPDATFAVDLQGRVISWNKAMEEMTGVKATVILGRGDYCYALPFYGKKRPLLLDIFLNNDLAKTYYPNVEQEGDIYVAEVKNLLLNGREVVLSCRASRLYDQKGEVIGAIESIRDVTEENLASDNIRRYNVLFNQLRDVTFFLKPDGTIVDVNPAALEVYGYSKEEFLNLTIFDLRPDEPKAKIIKEMAEANKRGIRFKTWHRRKDGSKIYVDISSKGINYNNQSLLVSVIRDISEQKEFEQALRQIIDNLEKTVQGTVQALAAITEYRDSYTAGHQQRVANLAVSIAKEMGLPEEKIEALYIAGILHDVGKVSLPTEILSKPAELSGLETALVKTHCTKGYEIIKNIPFKHDVASIILQHHERLDGSGYPQGLKGQDILLEARILAVADVIEAMSTHRPYRPAPGLHQAVVELVQNKGTLYDPEVVDACLRIYSAQKLEKIISQ